jgi:signal transduction histidine kinase
VLREIAKIVALATVYVIVARLGLMLDAVAGFATLVWPPTGISLVALVFFGPKLWSGVTLGAFITNLLAGAPVPVALGIGAGNTLEAVVGAYALVRIPGFRRSIDTVRAVLCLVFASVASTVVSATIGVGSLFAGRIVESHRLAETWVAWWVGDLIADLVVAPLLLVWLTPRHSSDPRKRKLEACAIAVGVVAVSVFIYESPANAVDGTSIVRQSYLFYPLLMWAALRFGQRETVTTAFVVAAIAIAGTAMGHGPFVLPSLHQSLLGLQTFMGVSAATFLVLGASIAERRHVAADLEDAHHGMSNLLRELAEAVQARDALISIASHELRTPLSALQLQVDLIARTVDRGANAGTAVERDPSSTTLASRLSTVDRQVTRLTRLIDNLLDVSRITAGRLQLEYEDFDLSSAVREVLSRFEDEAKRAGCPLSIRSDEPTEGRWDRMRIEQIVTNLISNAIKYAAGKPIEVTVEAKGDWARLTVKDHGIGIAESDQLRIFERFERVVSGRQAGGFGLGLWIVREIVQALGGTIRVESRLGEGTSFVVDLPRKDSSSGPHGKG